MPQLNRFCQLVIPPTETSATLGKPPPLSEVPDEVLKKAWLAKWLDLLQPFSIAELTEEVARRAKQ